MFLMHCTHIAVSSQNVLLLQALPEQSRHKLAEQSAHTNSVCAPVYSSQSGCIEAKAQKLQQAEAAIAAVKAVQLSMPGIPGQEDADRQDKAGDDSAVGITVAVSSTALRLPSQLVAAAAAGMEADPAGTHSGAPSSQLQGKSQGKTSSSTRQKTFSRRQTKWYRMQNPCYRRQAFCCRTAKLLLQAASLFAPEGNLCAACGKYIRSIPPHSSPQETSGIMQHASFPQLAVEVPTLLAFNTQSSTVTSAEL